MTEAGLCVSLPFTPPRPTPFSPSRPLPLHRTLYYPLSTTPPLLQLPTHGRARARPQQAAFTARFPLISLSRSLVPTKLPRLSHHPQPIPGLPSPSAPRFKCAPPCRSLSPYHIPPPLRAGRHPRDQVARGARLGWEEDSREVLQERVRQPRRGASPPAQWAPPSHATLPPCPTCLFTALAGDLACR
eukprot:scaffold15540_cov31-Tisochrysis_lutea.AAC.8